MRRLVGILVWFVFCSHLLTYIPGHCYLSYTPKSATLSCPCSLLFALSFCCCNPRPVTSSRILTTTSLLCTVADLRVACRSNRCRVFAVSLDSHIPMIHVVRSSRTRSFVITINPSLSFGYTSRPVDPSPTNTNRVTYVLPLPEDLEASHRRNVQQVELHDTQVLSDSHRLPSTGPVGSR